MSNEFDPRIAIGAYVFALDWRAARSVVESDPWYRSEDAQVEMDLVLSEAQSLAQADTSHALVASLIELAQQSLTLYRSHGSHEAFRQLEELDAKLEGWGKVSCDELLLRIRDDRSFLTDQSLISLQHLVLRASINGDAQRGESLFEGGKIIEAELIASGVRGQPPQHANGELVSTIEQAISLLERHRCSALWLELKGLLGSFLIENPEGDRTDNIRRAEDAYNAILSCVTQQQSPDVWGVGMSGLANALSCNPTTVDRQERSIQILEELIAHHRSRGCAAGPSSALINCARVLAQLKHGDVDQHLDRAITMQKEVIKLLESEDGQPIDDVQWARAQHNLACMYNKHPGVRSHNVDAAVQALNSALSIRSADRFPVDRVRTLRALALIYPEWSGADSLHHAQELARQATEEADAVEQSDPAANARVNERVDFNRQRSALRENIDPDGQTPPDEYLTWLQGVRANHVRALHIYSPGTEPKQWAEWMGGLGHVLARLHVFEVGDAHSVREHFQQAVQVAEQTDDRKLLRDLHLKFGEWCHLTSDWSGSFESHATAVQIGHELFNDIATHESRLRALNEFRGAALFASWAAYMLGRLDDAVCLAEAERARSFVDITRAAGALSQGSDESRNLIREITSRINALETEMRALAESDPEAMLTDVRGKLADFLGIQPDSPGFGMRLTNRGTFDEKQAAADRQRIAESLAQARQELRQETDRALADESDPNQLLSDAQEIIAIANSAQRPLSTLR